MKACECTVKLLILNRSKRDAHGEGSADGNSGGRTTNYALAHVREKRGSRREGEEGRGFHYLPQFLRNFLFVLGKFRRGREIIIFPLLDT